MDNHKNNRIDPWDEGVYGTGKTEPPKSNSGIVALLMIIIIFLSGIISGLSFMNIRLFHQLQEVQHQADFVPMVFSEVESDSEENLIREDYDDTESVSIPYLGITGDYVSPFDQHYFNWPAGLLVTLVEDGSKAESLGLEVGDILVSINDASITSHEALDAVFAAGESDTFLVTVYRDGAQLTLNETN